MVGSSSFYPEQGNSLVLKLYNLINSSSVTSLIYGTFENVMISENNPKYLGPISILLFPRLNYQYSSVSTNIDNSCSIGSEHTPNSLQVERFCSLLSSVVLNHDFQLKYSSHCATPKNCNPISLSDWPRAVSLKNIACSEDKERVRVLVEFLDSWPNWKPRLFNPSTSLIGEGSWDAEKKQLCVVACQFLYTTNSLNNTNVGDCSTRLKLRIPATGTIGSTSSIVGHIWSTKTITELGYFEKITFASRECYHQECLLLGQTYEYTKMDEVSKLCPRKKTANNKTIIYPHPVSHAMSFIMHAQNSEGQVGSGNCVPLSVGNQFYKTDYSTVSNNEYPATPLIRSHNQSSSHNISYKIDLQLQSNPKLAKPSVRYEMHISAEGIYDDTDGSLCMVGCRDIGSNSQQPTKDSIDCEILINLQFPANKAKESRHIKGSIISTREKSDPLHFERLDVSTAAKDEGSRSIYRTDGKMTLFLISTTLSCIFAASQLFHLKKNPEVIPSISILMLLILTLGYMLPLGINFEAMSVPNFDRHKSHNVYLRGGGWLEFNEIIIRVTTLITFLILLHILKLTWSVKSGTGCRKELQVIEKKVVFLALQMYFVGALAALFLLGRSQRKRNNGIELHRIDNTLLDALTFYGRIVLDGFLFPQILLNMFCKLRENYLSVWFYIGTTLVRALPHVYDLYPAHSSVADHLDNYSHINPSPVEDFHSTAWNAIIPFGGLLFASIIYLQQRFGSCCMDPQRLQLARVGYACKGPYSS